MNNGIDIPTNNSITTIGATSSRVLPSAARNVLTLRNSSTGGQIITFSMGNLPAALNEGIVLSVGQMWVDSDNGEYKCWEGEIQAISTGADGKLSVVERGR